MKTCVSILLCALGVLFVLALDVRASDEIVLTDTTASVAASLHADILEDRTGRLTFDDVSSPGYAHEFIPSHVARPGGGYTTSTFWMRFAVANETSQTGTWLLEFEYPALDFIDLYSHDADGTLVELHAGDCVPFAERRVAYRNSVFPLELAPGERRTYYAQIRTESSAILSAFLWSPIGFAEKVGREQIAFGVFYGILLSMLFYNLFLLLSLRDRSYFYYVLYILSFGFFVFSWNGLAFQYLWPGQPWLVNRAMAALWALTLLAVVLFARSFLDLKTQLPRTDLVMRITQYVCAACAVAAMLGTYRTIAPVLNGSVIFICTTLLVTGVVCLRRGFRPARFYVAGWVTIFSLSVLQALTNLHVLAPSFLSIFGPQLGAALEAILLSFALADRINLFEQEKKAAQAEALRQQKFLNEELEKTVLERTREIRLAKDAADHANQAKSDFLANMSHELRTPLNAILGFAQVMNRTPGRVAADRDTLDIMLRSGEHLLGLINDVLSIAKIESGKNELAETVFDPKRLLRAVAEMVRVRAHEKNLDVILEIDPALPDAVRGDEGKIRQVLLNLLGNAVKFTEAGHIRLAVRATLDSGRAVFEVEDTGFGIEQDELDRLFEPFAQTASGKQSREGTGLGLVISRGMVRMMGGEIEVHSRAGIGTRFSFDIPLPPADEAAARAQTRRVQSLAPNQRVPKLLVVDDSTDGRTALVRLLAAVGFDVREASNGQQAIDVWRAWRPDLIWMDIRMDVMNGLEATRQIRAESGVDGPVIIALTASAFEHERESIVSAGCDGFLSKPYREATIFDTLGRHLDVEFLYEHTNDADLAAIEPAGSTVTPARLAAIPPEVLMGLKNALTIGDGVEAMSILDRIRLVDEPLATEMAVIVRGYNFDELLTLLESP